MLRDDLIVNDSYATASNHDEEHGRALRKKIYFVTILLSVLTAIEIGMGIFLSTRDSGYWPVVKWTFIAMTLIKAAYIVMEFMHLGHEKKSFKIYVLLPYLFFIIYIMYFIIYEGFSVNTYQ